MATSSFQCLHNHQSLHRLHPMNHRATTFPSPFLKPTTTTTTSCLPQSLSSFTPTSTPSPTTSSPSSKSTISFKLLKHHLSTKDFQQADKETRNLLLILAGEAAQKRGYIFFSEVQFIPKSHLKAIDELWREHSNNRYGYSVQKKIWEEEQHDFSRLFIKIGWMKKLDTQVEQFNYKSFPDEFSWGMNDDDDTPHGHLPLTNALRGVQLLKSILTHQAFDDTLENEAEEEEENEEGDDLEMAGSISRVILEFWRNQELFIRFHMHFMVNLSS